MTRARVERHNWRSRQAPAHIASSNAASSNHFRARLTIALSAIRTGNQATERVPLASASMPGRRLAEDPIEQAAMKWRQHGWEDAADGMAVLTSIMRVQQVLIARVDEELRPFGLTLARYEVLMLLVFSRTGALPMGKVGERLQVHPASVTNAMDRLEKQSLVERR